MHPAELFLLFSQPLGDAGMNYMISGSVAAMVYGEPRLTNDVDIIVSIDAPQAHQLVAAFPPDAYYCAPEEVVAIESRRARRGHFNIIHHSTGHKADIYTSGTDPLQAWGLSRKRRVEIDTGVYIYIAPPEFVIVRKLEFYREGGSEKHLLDLRAMLAISGDDLDLDAMNEWIAAMGLTAQWELAAGT